MYVFLFSLLCRYLFVYVWRSFFLYDLFMFLLLSLVRPVLFRYVVMHSVFLSSCMSTVLI